MIRTRTRISTMLAVGLLALAGCTGGGGDPAPAPSAEESAPSDGGAGTSYATEGPGEDEPSEAAECKADDSDQDVPTEAPTADAWPDYHGTGVPVSDTYGPINRDGEVWSCFSHSPTGALFAAAYLRPAVASSEVREAYVSDDPQSSEGDFEHPRMQLRGYKITGYDDSSVSVELVYEGATNGESGLVAFPVTLYWEEDQWALHEEDISAAEPHSVTGLTGYTQWSVG